ncbi:MAG: hypothetical protein HC921_15540, partial [Synechococcaceae cyanobacterium SM2_3_1]|nr:hypothetical protein [Synechococcaceae cyanobacterium SM2_3_1]
MDRYSGPRLKLFLLIPGWAPILFLSLGAGIVILPMLRQGYPLVHSIHFNLMWVFQYSQQVFGGDFYPRWLESSFFGLGNPTFVFYPPLCMAAVLPFTALGWPAGSALVGSMLLATAVRGWGTYRLGGLLWPSPVAVAAALAAMASPYFLVDVYERGAIGEVWAISLIPWVLWAGWRLVLAVWLGQKRFSAMVVLAGSYALLGLAHLPALLVWTLVWLGLPWVMARTGRELRLLGFWLYGGTGMGLLLASFFLLPAALDQRWVSIDLINGWEMYDPLQRFLLIWNGQGLQLSQQEFDAHLVPYFWMALLLGLAGVGGMGLPERFRSQDPLARRGLLFLGLSTVLACVMMTSLSGPLYQI